MQLQRQRNCRGVAASIRLRYLGWRVPDTASSQVRRNRANNVSLYGGGRRADDAELAQSGVAAAAAAAAAPPRERDHLFIIPSGTRLRARGGRSIPSSSRSVRRAEFKFPGFRSPTLRHLSGSNDFLNDPPWSRPHRPHRPPTTIVFRTSLRHTFPVSGLLDDDGVTVHPVC